MIASKSARIAAVRSVKTTCTMFARREFEVLLDRTLGPAWRIERERQLQLEAEQETAIEDDLEPTIRKTHDLEIDIS